MSAIWGCVDLSGEPIEENLCAVMEQPLHAYKIDRYASISRGNVVMGCGVQYIKAESENECLPIYEADAGLYFTADCIIDNRADLIAGLCPGAPDIPDGELMYLAYKRWGGDACKRVYGAYSFAVYDKNAGTLTLVVDHVFNRALYYSRIDSRIYFSTAFEPIIAGQGRPHKANETWLALYLSMNTLSLNTNPTDTPYDGISRITASTYMQFSAAKQIEHEYWSPKAIKPLKLKNDAEYNAQFRTLLENVTKQTIRTNGNVGILLSSGFDSGTVAAFAAKELAGRGKSLNAYTYVPIDGYQNHYNARLRATNEQPGVERFCAMYPNINPHYLSLPEMDPVTSVRVLQEQYKLPYKSLTNIAWIDTFKSAAAQSGCKIMLDGQCGNVTISSGSIYTYARTNFAKGHIIRAVTALNRNAKLHRHSRKWTFKYFAQSLIPEWIQRISIQSYLKDSLVNKQTARKLGIKQKDKRVKNNAGIIGILTHKQELDLTFNKIAFAHSSDFDTASSLNHGMVSRDITKDIRVFEFCMSLPMDVKVNALPETRRLIRCYLADMFPRENLSETAPRGRQSGDWRDRMLPKWGAIYPELKRTLENPAIDRIADRDMISILLEKYRNPPGTEDEYEFMRLGAAYSAAVFLELLQR